MSKHIYLLFFLTGVLLGLIVTPTIIGNLPNLWHSFSGCDYNITVGDDFWDSAFDLIDSIEYDSEHDCKYISNGVMCLSEHYENVTCEFFSRTILGSSHSSEIGHMGIVCQENGGAWRTLV